MRADTQTGESLRSEGALTFKQKLLCRPIKCPGWLARRMCRLPGRLAFVGCHVLYVCRRSLKKESNEAEMPQRATTKAKRPLRHPESAADVS